MAHRNDLTWHQDRDDSWSAWADGRPIARITHDRQYELVSQDGTVRGSHSALGSAQAQLEAWYLWTATTDPDA
ncbi:hypothetical protein QUG98_02350 [Curtobacterium sp. RHCJP20]|uniref:Uncharacterized protein n=1 Tax=Curtobacterium subtropicum TaxID=3055138 RepID=A0ABT7TD48_9MICO|nr:hypothetical protein [Curtobacterium subtropicum]MDM7887284.1 hypothetical protein [Curtobacterium subtropicum]